MKKYLFLSLFIASFLSNLFAQNKQYNSLLWEISGNGLSKPSYLYGTMHVSEKLAFHLGDPFFNAIQSADAIALEVNPTTWLEDMLNSDYFKSEMNRSSSYDYYNNSEKTVYPFRYKFDRIDDFKTMLSEDPALLNGLMFRMTYGMEDFEEDTYLDMYIYKTAMKKGKEVYGIQKLDDLIKASIDAEIDRENKKNLPKKKSSTYDYSYNKGEKIEDAYRTQDLNLLDSLSNINADESFQEYILYKRNVIMANFIDSMVKTKSLFTGVGAAHLPGEKGIIEILRGMGYTLKPIQKGERNASTRDKLDNTILPLKLNVFKTSDGVLSFMAPNKVHEINEDGKNNSYLSSDLINGVWYLCSRHSHYRGLDYKSIADVKKDLQDYIYEYVPGKIISQKNISINGNEAISIINQTRKGDYQRIVLMITSDEMIMFKVGGISDIKKDMMGLEFINSIHYTKPIIKNWETFKFFTGEFSIDMPIMPIYFKSKKDTLILKNNVFLHSYDDATKTNYILQKAKGQMYLYIESDSNLLNDIIISGYDPLKNKTLIKKFDTYNGMNCVYATLKNEKEEYIHLMGLINGLDRYLLSIVSKDSTVIDKRFFNSLKIETPYAYTHFDTYVDTNLFFSSRIPYKEQKIVLNASATRKKNRKDRNKADVVDDEKVFIPNNFSGYLALDYVKYPKYFSIKDTSIYLDDQRKKITRNGDLVLVSEKLNKWNNGTIVQDFVLKDTASKLVSYISVYLKNNTRYTLFAQSNENQVYPFKDTFYNNFSIIDTGIKSVSVFDNNSELWYNDASSLDSLTKENAFEIMNTLKVNPNDGTKLIQIFEKEVPATDDYLERRLNLILKMGNTGDSNLLSYLNKIYIKYSDTSLYQFAVLHALLRINGAKSNKLFCELFRNDLPLSDDDNVIDDLMYEICDSAKTKKDILPELINISSIQEYKSAVYYLLGNFLDSNLISSKNYESIKSTLLNDGKIALKKYISGDNSSNLDQSNNYIYHIAKLLAPFYTDEGVKMFFQKGINQNFDKALKVDFAVIMQKNHIKVEDTIQKQLMREKYIRPYYYTQLQDEKLKINIDSSYMNIDSIAFCMFYYLNGDRFNEPDSVTLIKKIYLNANVNKGYIYFFKYKEKLDINARWQYAYVGSINDKNPVYLKANNTDLKIKYLGIKENDTPENIETNINNTILKMARRENISNHTYEELYEKEDNYNFYLNSYNKRNYDYDYDFDF